MGPVWVPFGTHISGYMYSLAYFTSEQPLRAVPGEGARRPIGAKLAGERNLVYNSFYHIFLSRYEMGNAGNAHVNY